MSCNYLKLLCLHLFGFMCSVSFTKIPKHFGYGLKEDCCEQMHFLEFRTVTLNRKEWLICYKTLTAIRASTISCLMKWSTQNLLLVIDEIVEVFFCVNMPQIFWFHLLNCEYLLIYLSSFILIYFILRALFQLQP